MVSSVRLRAWLLAGFAIAAAAALLLLPPIQQDPGYHSFADHRTLWNIPNFWNVISNVPFFLVAILGVPAMRSTVAFLHAWERIAYGILLAGVGAVAFGSAYYHAWPGDATLVWDRLPMTTVFMALLASTIGERVAMPAGRLLLFPLLVLGIASVLYWKISGDLRPYVFVQFYPVVALPFMFLLFPARYTGAAWLWGMIGLYGLAKLFELLDARLGTVIGTGGHPWKHLAGAAAMFCYVRAIGHRHALKQ